MPLPAALAAKLAKRGLISKFNDCKINSSSNSSPLNSSSLSAALPSSHRGYEGCPNKYNVYHECTKYCMQKWKVGIITPNRTYMARREKLLKKYPLSNNWKEIYDRGCGRFYYWDIEKDLVSWLPPKHPRCVPSYSAAFLREELYSRLLKLREKRDADAKRKQQSEEKDKKERLMKPKSHKRFHSSTKEDLDPMDPAAYSDIPRGSWSTGLESRSESKTGADTTASGSLFHVRPYPSPGTVLAANAKAKRSSK